MIMLSKFSNFPDKLSKNDELREYELSGSDCTSNLYGKYRRVATILKESGKGKVIIDA